MIHDLFHLPSVFTHLRFQKSRAIIGAWARERLNETLALIADVRRDLSARLEGKSYTIDDLLDLVRPTRFEGVGFSDPTEMYDEQLWHVVRDVHVILALEKLERVFTTLVQHPEVTSDLSYEDLTFLCTPIERDELTRASTRRMPPRDAYMHYVRTGRTAMSVDEFYTQRRR